MAGSLQPKDEGCCSYGIASSFVPLLLAHLSFVRHRGSYMDISRVSVVLSKRFNREPHPTNEPHIEAAWHEVVERNPRVFNGLKFRFHHAIALEDASLLEGATRSALEGLDAHETPNPSSSNTEALECIYRVPQAMVFCLGGTDYKHYLTTNVKLPHLFVDAVDESRQPLADGLQGFTITSSPQEHHRYRHLGNALGCGVLFFSVEGAIVLIHRSNQVSEACGLYDVPGGHPEPQSIDEHVQSIEEVVALDATRVRDELYLSAIREVEEELGVPTEYRPAPSEFLLFAPVPNAEVPGKISLCFIWRTNLSLEKIAEWYRAAPDSYESRGLGLIWPSNRPETFSIPSVFRDITLEQEEALLTPFTKQYLRYYRASGYSI